VHVVLGGRGRLGNAIAASLPSHQLAAPERAIYSEWWRAHAADGVSRYLEGLPGPPGVVYVAAGIIDPARAREEHEKINYLLARNVIDGSTRLGYRVLTFGTVMETLVGADTNSPYYASKRQLGQFVQAFSPSSGSVLHVRLHTVFGGALPAAFTFLGQILRALLARAEFKMSPGTQLREYHHVDDEVRAILGLASGNVGSAIDLSHGQPVTLRELAIYVFEAFDCLQLLRIGALPAPAADNFGVVFKRTAAIDALPFRPTLPAVADYLKQCRTLAAI